MFDKSETIEIQTHIFLWKAPGHCRIKTGLLVLSNTLNHQGRLFVQCLVLLMAYRNLTWALTRGQIIMFIQNMYSYYKTAVYAEIEE